LTAMYSTTAILAALYERQKSGIGQQIDLALLDVQIATLANQAANYLMSGKVPRRSGNAHDSIVPYQSFPTADGEIILAVANDLQFQKLAVVLGIPGLGENPDYRTNGDRVRNRQRLLSLIIERLQQRPSAEWLADFERAQIPAGPINALDAVFRDPQIEARNLVVEFPRNGHSDTVRVVGNPIRFLRTPIRHEVPPPKLGEHTKAILSDVLGRSDKDIAALSKKKVI
jgi:crotonobetainyl-CoA:carnitine CoA-transferase CaiB-like acyl-CoA transferase